MSGYGTATNDTHPRLSDTEIMTNLRKENAKLRELVREMYAAIDMADYVHDFDDPIHLMFVDDLRELGVEVDG